MSLLTPAGVSLTVSVPVTHVHSGYNAEGLGLSKLHLLFVAPCEIPRRFCCSCGSRVLQDRGNGVKLLIRVLEALVEEVPSLRLVDVKGGDKHNAIPREAFATVLLPKGDLGWCDLGVNSHVSFFEMIVGVPDVRFVAQACHLPSKRKRDGVFSLPARTHRAPESHLVGVTSGNCFPPTNALHDCVGCIPGIRCVVLPTSDVFEPYSEARRSVFSAACAPSRIQQSAATDRDLTCQAVYFEVTRPPAPIVTENKKMPSSYSGDSAALDAAKETASDIFDELKMEFGTKEPSLQVQIREDNDAEVGVCLGEGAARRLLALLELLPHGVMKISHDVEGLVSLSGTR